MTDGASSAERAAVVKWLRMRADRFTMARCIFWSPLQRFRARWIAAGLRFTAREIERGDHLTGVDPQEHLARRGR